MVCGWEVKGRYVDETYVWQVELCDSLSKLPFIKIHVNRKICKH